MQLNEIKQIGIVGAGIMGPGIAEVLALFGATYDFEIRIFDISKTAIEKSKSRMNSDFKKVASVGVYSNDELKAARKRIQFTLAFSDLSESNLAIEAVPEKIKLKKKIFKDLDTLTSFKTILATNSSGLSITEIASSTNRPELCIGTHFMNPPILMPLVEVVQGEKTSKQTVKVVMELLSNVNKQPVLVKNDIPGYVHNRLQAAVFRELLYLMKEDIMTITDLEKTVRYGLGLRLPVMKVFEMVDLMGLDTIVDVLSYLFPTLDNSSAPPRFLKDMIGEGKLGVKSGIGFHDYSNKEIQTLMNQKQAATLQLLMLMQQHD